MEREIINRRSQHAILWIKSDDTPLKRDLGGTVGLVNTFQVTSSKPVPCLMGNTSHAY